MGKYSEFLKDLDARLKELDRETSEVKAAMNLARRFEDDEKRLVARGLVVPNATHVPFNDDESPIPPKKAGNRDHMRRLLKEAEEARELHYKAYFLHAALATEGLTITQRNKMDARVTNSLQSLRNDKEAGTYKTGTSNQSTVWGPISAFNDDGIPKPEWRIADQPSE